MSQEDSENGFELVDRPKDTHAVQDGPSPLPTWLPINLPSGGQLFPSTSTPLTSAAPQTFVAPVPITPITSQKMAAPIPLVLPELGLPVVSPVVVDANFQKSMSALELGMIESPTSSVMTDSSVQEEKQTPPPTSGGGLFSWVKEAIPGKQILAKVAEKAKSSMDYAITTLDPQMKEIIYSGGSIDITVTSNKEVKVSAVREAFQTVFGKATIKGSEPASSSSSEVAAQPVGFSSALQAADERIRSARSLGLVDPARQAVVSVEGFVVELFPDNWFEMNCLVLDDPVRKVRLHTFSQPLMIPAAAVKRMKDATPSSYPLRQSGFAVTVGQAMAEEFNVPATEWQAQLAGVSRREILVLAAKTLANSYK